MSGYCLDCGNTLCVCNSAVPDDCGRWVVTEEPCFHLCGNVRITITEITP